MSDSLDVPAPVVQETPPAEPAAPPQAPVEEKAAETDGASPPPIDPTVWLDEAERVAEYAAAGGGPPQPPPRPAEPQYREPSYQPYNQYNEPPPQKPKEFVDRQLANFVDDPDGYVDALVERRVAQRIAPLLQEVQDARMKQDSFLTANAQENIGAARAAIERAYDIFNQDEVFVNDRRIQTQVGKTFDTMYRDAVYNAKQGNFGPIIRLANLNEAQARGALGAAKGMFGSPSRPESPHSVYGGMVESSTPGRQTYDVQLTPEEEDAIAVIERQEPGYRQRYIEERKTSIERGDFGV